MPVSCPHCSKAVEGAILKAEHDAEVTRKVGVAQTAAQAAVEAAKAEAATAVAATEAIGVQLVTAQQQAQASVGQIRAAQAKAVGLKPEFLPVLEMAYNSLPEENRPTFEAAIGADGALRAHAFTAPYFTAAPAVVAPPAAPAGTPPAAPAAATPAATTPPVVDPAALAAVLAQFGVKIPAGANQLPIVTPGATPPAKATKLTPMQVKAQIDAVRHLPKEERDKRVHELRSEYDPNYQKSA